MSRLPVPGGDDGVWGDILNDYLSVSHNADGTEKNGGSASIPLAEPGSFSIDSTTYDNEISGSGKYTALISTDDDAALAVIARQGDAFPQWLWTSQAADGLYFGDGTYDPYSGSNLYPGHLYLNDGTFDNELILRTSDIIMVSNTQEVFHIQSSGAVTISPISGDPLFQVNNTSGFSRLYITDTDGVDIRAYNNTNALRVVGSSSGSQAVTEFYEGVNGIGSLRMEHDGYIVVTGSDGNEKTRVGTDGVSFFGVLPVAQQTTTDLTSLAMALKNYGLLDNASTITGGASLGWSDIQPVGVRVQVLPLHAESASTNWSTIIGGTTDAGAAHTQVLGTRESSGAQNAEVTFKVVLAAGTWKLHLITLTYNTAGIQTVSMDGVSQGTIDQYAATLAVNVPKTLTGITVATSGVHDLNFKMATKNASSSNYFGDLALITLERTA